MAPARVGDQLIARAETRTCFGHSGIYDVTVTKKDGTVIAEMRGRSLELRSGQP